VIRVYLVSDTAQVELRSGGVLRPWVAADNREIALSDIAARTKLSVDGVEYLLMKAGFQLCALNPRL